MTGRPDLVLAAVADRLDGASWPDEVSAALEVIRKHAAGPERRSWSKTEDGVPLPIAALELFDDIGPYDSGDPVLVDLAAAAVEYAASLEGLAEIYERDPSSSLPHDQERPR